jgi:hypothetical protein
LKEVEVLQTIELSGLPTHEIGGGFDGGMAQPT